MASLSSILAARREFEPSLATFSVPDNTTISAFGATLVDDANAAAARDTLALGTAATQDTGTGANNVVQLDGSSRLPAVDGSLLTNLPGGGGSVAIADITDWPVGLTATELGYLDGVTSAIQTQLDAKLVSGDIGVSIQGYSAVLDATTASFTTTLLTKLNAIEAGATADQTGAEIKVAYEAEADTNAYTDAEKAKVGHLTVTQAVDLDAIETRVNALDAAVVLKGTWDASAGAFPGAGSAQAGESWIVAVAGTVDGNNFAEGDRILAIVDNASTTIFANNWFKLDYTDRVASVAGKVGAVTLVKADITDLNEADYATAAQGALADTALQAAAIGVSIQGYSAVLAATTASYTTAEETKLAGIAEGADVTNTASVTAAGALMDSEVANLPAVKAFNPADYATAAQGATADSAVQPGDDADTLGSGAALDGHILTADGLGGAAWEPAPSGGTVDVLSNVATSTILGRVTAGSGDSEELTAAQVRTLINVADGATVNDTDANLLNRANHTGLQAIGTITGLQTALDGKATSAQGALADAALQPAAIGVSVQGYDADTMKADVHATLTAGFDSTAEALGTGSGTVTPEVDAAGKQNFKSLTNNGAFTLAPPSTSNDCVIRIHVINGASAGTITTTGFDRVIDNDTYATTNAKEYWFIIDHNATRSTLTIVEII